MALQVRTRKNRGNRSAARRRRAFRGRKKIFGYPERPRMVVNRSSRHMTVQIIDDVAGNTLVSASTMEAELREMDGDKTARATKLGELIAQRAKDAGVTKVILDRAGNQYHGRIAAMADAAREAGLEF